MNRRFVPSVLGVFLLLCIMSSPLRANQVVTGEDRGWAKNAIKQEKTLEAAPAPNTVAVLYFHNQSTNPQLDPLQKGFAFLLMTDLTQVDGITLVERVKLQALVEELGLGSSGLVEKGSAPRVGKLLGAGYLVGGDLTSSQQVEFGVKSDLIQVKSQNSLGQPSANGTLGQLFDVEKQVLFKIIDLLKIKLTPEKKFKLEKPITTNLNAFLNFMKGIGCSDRGNYKDAAEYYNQAMMEDPQFRLAQDALNELKSLHLISAPGKSRAMLKELESKTSTTNTLGKDYPLQESNNPGVIQKESESGNIKVNW